MRRIVSTILSTISIMVLLFSYHTSSSSATVSASPVVRQPASSDPNPPSGSLTSGGSSKSGGTSTTRPGPAAKPSPPAAIAYTGGVASTRWGPVRVRITVRGGKVTRAQAVQYPQGTNQDAQINSYALPILDQEVVQKQSASIDTVSGATVTSDGYLQSLQSAIDQAHL